MSNASRYHRVLRTPFSMASFDFPHPLMSSLDTFSGDAYADFIAHSQPYATEAATLPSIDSFDAMLPYTAIPAAPDMSYFSIARPAGSPSVSPGDPYGGLPSASESGASAQSATSSTMASPHLRPQLSAEPWRALSAVMEPTDGGAGVARPDAYFSTSGQDSNVPGYVGESRISSLSFRSSVAFAGWSRLALSYFASASPPMPASPVERRQSVGPEPSPTGLERSVFKSPGLPASASTSRRHSNATPPTYETHASPVGVNWRRHSVLSAESNFSPSRPGSQSPRVSVEGLISPVFPMSHCSSRPYAPDRFLFLRRREDLLLTGAADPQELNPLSSPAGFAYPDVPLASSGPYFTQAAPVPSQPAAPGKVKSSSRRVPYNVQSFATYPYQTGRRLSTSSVSQNSSHRSSFDDDENTRDVCPIPDCGRSFKDLRAHMLTHQNERPEKCPIQTCEYHVKGFARKYDKNRHTLTHYKGTMVCGFCPGSGSGGEKTFNRADVFKRHLTSVHAVEQVAPNSRRKSPTLRGRTTLSVAASGPVMGLASRGLAGGVAPPTGRCSTCSGVFASAQDFYEHLDDCVLRVVQQIDPSEAINEMHLAAIATDSDVRATLERHNLPVDDVAPTTVADDAAVKEEEDDDEDAADDDEDDDEDDDCKPAVDTTSTNPRSGKGAIQPASSSSSSSSAPARGGGGGGGGSNWHSSDRVRKADRAGRPGLTFSKGGVRSYHQALAAAAASAGGPGSKGESSAASNSTSIATMSARKRRRHLYPAAWGGAAGADGARMKKRVVCVYDGRRRLCKDDMMLDSEFEVRVPLASGASSAPPELGRGGGGGDDDDEGAAGEAGAARAESPAGAPPAAGTAYVTDLDVQTLRRADAIFSATEEERGPWIPDNVLEMDFNDDLA